MCGIFCMVGDGCLQNTITALKGLEYRGYDSAGVCVKREQIQLYKSVGRVQRLEEILPQEQDCVSCIGHTRWATHGGVCVENAHPFASYDGNFAIVHNGVIENHRALKNSCTCPFVSQTDSEVVAHLLADNYNGDLLRAVTTTAQILKGAFAIAIANNYDDKIYLVKRKSPLVVGLSQQGACACSDTRRISHFAKKIAFLPDDTVAVLDKKEIRFFDFFGNAKVVELAPVQAEVEEVKVSQDMMLTEILQIPQKITQAKRQYFADGGLRLPKRFVKKLKRIYFVGCGTAYHAGLQTCAVGRKLLNVELIPVVASEFIYDGYPIDGNTLAFCISQSGETADTLRAVEKINANGGYTYAVTNSVTSSIACSCKGVANVSADGEYAVASTKAYNCQLVTLLLLVLDIAKIRNSADAQTIRGCLDGLDSLPIAVEHILANANQLQRLAQEIQNSSAVFYLGKTLDYPTACEGSLKLKEISYIHSEAYPAGELKHGTLALMERGVTVIALSTNYELTDKMETAVAEVVSRGARVIALSPYRVENAQNIILPTVNQYLYGIISVVPLQLLAYFVAKGLGRDVDKPRNLAKSVTVE